MTQYYYPSFRLALGIVLMVFLSTAAQAQSEQLLPYLDGKYGSGELAYAKLTNAKELVVKSTDNAPGIEVVSFDLYLIARGKETTCHNEGGEISNSCRTLLQSIGTEHIVTFDNIVAKIPSTPETTVKVPKLTLDATE